MTVVICVSELFEYNTKRQSKQYIHRFLSLNVNERISEFNKHVTCRL